MDFPTATPTTEAATALSGPSLNFNKSAISGSLAVVLTYLTEILSILYLRTAALAPLLLAQLWLCAGTLFGYVRQMDVLVAFVYPYFAILVDLVRYILRQFGSILLAMPALFPYIKFFASYLLYPIRFAIGLIFSAFATIFSPVFYTARYLGILAGKPVVFLSWILWRLKVRSHAFTCHCF